MKTIDLTTSPLSLEELLHLASEGSVILRTSEGKEFLVGEVDDFQKEVDRVAQNPELMEFLAERSRSSQRYSLDQARAILGLD